MSTLSDHRFDYSGAVIAAAAEKQALKVEASINAMEFERLRKLLHDQVDGAIALCDHFCPPDWDTEAHLARSGQAMGARIETNGGAGELGRRARIAIDGELYDRLVGEGRRLSRQRNEVRQLREAASRYGSQADKEFSLDADDVRYFGLDA